MSTVPVPPVPEAARVVAEWIRNDVPRPDEKSMTCRSEGWRFTRLGYVLTCPLGLHKDARFRAPEGREHFYDAPPDAITNYALRSFCEWWDSVPGDVDKTELLDAVWGPR